MNPVGNNRQVPRLLLGLTIAASRLRFPRDASDIFDSWGHRKPSGPCYPSSVTPSGIDKGLGIFSSAEVPDSFLPASMEAPGRRIINRRTKHAGVRLNQPRLKEGRSMALIASRDWLLTVVGEIPCRLLHGAGVPKYRSNCVLRVRDDASSVKVPVLGTFLPQPGADPICLQDRR